MTSVLIERGKNGILLSCKATGHAGYAGRGFDIVCSAVTVLIRTTMEVVSGLPGVKLDSDVSRRGNLSFTVNADQPDDFILARLIYAGDFLETGLGSVSREYPEYLELKTVIIEI